MLSLVIIIIQFLFYKDVRFLVTHVYTTLLIWYYIVVVVAGKWGMSGTLPSYEVLSQRNVTMFTGCDFLCLNG